MQKITRKNFIEASALSTIGFILFPQCLKPNIEENKEKSIIVIGAGIAGLSAAKKLTEFGFNVTVLEANQTYGGRINSVNLNGDIVDSGASWIHGIRHNPIYKIAEDLNLDTRKTYYEPGYLYDIDGSEITDEEWKVVEKRLNELYNLAYDYTGKSLEELLDIYDPNPDFSDRMTRVFYGAIRSEIEIGYAVDAQNLSSVMLTKDDAFAGDEVIFKNGFIQILDFLAKDLNIVYNNFVTKISYLTDKVNIYTKNTLDLDSVRSCIACHSNSDAEIVGYDNIYSADRVVVALPAGMLKQNIIVFEPAFSTEKINAISGIGIGTMNKVILKFTENFWQKNAYFLQVLNKDYTKNMEFFSPSPTGIENILYGILAGQHARSIENLSESEVIEMVMSQLKIIFGENIPNPINYVITKWHTNPLALGAYPHIKPGFDYDICDKIAEPLDNKVFFAGDYIVKDYMSTAHGSYISGENSANNILKTF